jgi:DeoR/GlpR family transcriptional regulator of sugar metabolism
MLATEARLIGYGGVRAVTRIAEASETTIRKSVFELEQQQRCLKSGSGAPSFTARSPDTRPTPVDAVLRNAFREKCALRGEE